MLGAGAFDRAVLDVQLEMQVADKSGMVLDFLYDFEGRNRVDEVLWLRIL